VGDGLEYPLASAYVLYFYESHGLYISEENLGGLEFLGVLESNEMYYH